MLSSQNHESHDFQRKNSQASLEKFLHSKGAGLVFLRGRRRVGKSNLLKSFQIKNLKKCFYFTGALDEGGQETIKRFILEWSKFNPLSKLRYSDARLINWKVIFEEIHQDIKSSLQDTWIFFDEIQWLAKARNGFVGLFKEAWIDFEKLHNIKIILCGSSNKFFIDNAGGEEKILRGLVTRSDIYLRPFYPEEVKRYFGKNISNQEAMFLYMCFGGIPYYLNKFNFSLGFLTAFNNAVMQESSIFLNEVNEVLNLDFNKKGLTSIVKIFAAFKQRYATFETLQENSKLAGSTLSEALEKLVQYGLITENIGVLSNAKKKTRYFYYTDFYLSFYFRFLVKHKVKVKKNFEHNLFVPLLSSKGSLYIENFTGIAFENYVQYLIEHMPSNYKLLKELEIAVDEEFTVLPDFRCDLLVKSEGVKVLRLIECKWSNNNSVVQDGIRQLGAVDMDGQYEGYVIKKYVVTNCEVTAATRRLGGKLGVTVLRVGV